MAFEFNTSGISHLAAHAGPEFVIFDMEHTCSMSDVTRTLIAHRRRRRSLQFSDRWCASTSGTFKTSSSVDGSPPRDETSSGSRVGVPRQWLPWPKGGSSPPSGRRSRVPTRSYTGIRRPTARQAFDRLVDTRNFEADVRVTRQRGDTSVRATPKTPFEVSQRSISRRSSRCDVGRRRSTRAASASTSFRPLGPRRSAASLATTFKRGSSNSAIAASSPRPSDATTTS